MQQKCIWQYSKYIYLPITLSFDNAIGKYRRNVFQTVR